MIRVAIIDDDALTLQLLKRILESAGIEVPAVARDGDEAVALVRSMRPDVVLMDLRMERMDGIEATKRVLELDNPPGIIALTSFDTEAAIMDAMTAGADGLLAKTSGPEEIIEAVRQVAAGNGALSPRAARVVIESVRNSAGTRHQREAAARLQELSERERQIAVAVAQGKTNAEIAREFFVSETTVKSHLVTILAKSEAGNRVQLAALIVAAGWRVRE
ncbi:response regulator transcription factor [Rarobacter incanus]|uniref:LuxR family two component transcriptional regulator n=1 Tax=Rarobacter incanus TaxID=153494 RepID=A0A542SPB0_9MICO|nr:response regulator transcription factor [Rarobacter incanus]TQK76453.1 LuxR family two component transcriptional regulator [Rarobacter incanus]